MKKVDVRLDGKIKCRECPEQRAYTEFRVGSAVQWRHESSHRVYTVTTAPPGECQ